MKTTAIREALMELMRVVGIDAAPMVALALSEVKAIDALEGTESHPCPLSIHSLCARAQAAHATGVTAAGLGPAQGGVIGVGAQTTQRPCPYGIGCDGTMCEACKVKNDRRQTLAAVIDGRKVEPWTPPTDPRVARVEAIEEVGRFLAHSVVPDECGRMTVEMVRDALVWLKRAKRNAFFGSSIKWTSQHPHGKDFNAR